MARAATTLDTFNAVAEPRRRQILDLLVAGEQPVNDLVNTMQLAQPYVSRHLRVLREVGAVDVREDGRHRIYRLNGPALRPIHQWVSPYEQFWSNRMALLTDVVTDLMQNDPSTARNTDRNANPKRK